MWACSASRSCVNVQSGCQSAPAPQRARVPGLGAVPRAAALLAVLGLLAAAQPAAARHHFSMVRGAGSHARHVVIDDHGVTISNDDTTVTDTAGATTTDADERGDDVVIGGPTVHVHGEGAGLVRVFADAEVPAGQHVDGDVVAVFGSVDVTGSVSGDVVAVFGSVRLRPGAYVSGDVVSIGGVLDHPANATVGGQSVSLGFLPIAWGLPALPALLGTVFALWLATLLFGWLLAALTRDRMARAAETAARHTAGSFVLGVLSMPLLVLAMTLLFVTLVGIPVALLLLVLYPVIVWAGQVVGMYLIGCRLTRRQPGEGGMVGPIAAGALLVAAFFVVAALLAGPPGPTRSLALFLGLLGSLLAVGLASIGTGALLLSRGGGRPPSPAPQPAAAPPPVGASMPPALPPPVA
jgi:hypothetical protein